MTTRLALECTVEGCTNGQHSRGWCTKHYLRNYHHGSPTYKRPRAIKAATAARDRVPRSYVTAHRWLKKQRGLAVLHTCIDCGQQAAEWSYTYDGEAHSDDHGEHMGKPWSPDPEQYEPRCHRCHKHFDMLMTGNAC